MINAHTHIFTIKHVPEKFLPLFLRLVAKVAVKKWMVKLLKKLKLAGPAYLLNKFYNFKKIGELGSQEQIFNHLQGFYPEGTGFVTLSMDMEYMGAGKVPEPFNIQLKQLAKLKQNYGDEIHPFVFAHPERPKILEIVTEHIEQHKFGGIKIYPAIGYFPSDKRLDDVYKYAEDKQIPIMTHCTRGGVYYKGKLTPARRRNPLDGKPIKKTKNRLFTDYYSDPDQYQPILEKHNDLKICFAHYGGSDEWDRFLNESWHDKAPDSWLYKINQYIKSDKYKNVYTDVSYTLVRSDLFPVLKAYLESIQALRSRVLFGTDYYMTEQEGSERFFGLNLRGAIGEPLWKQIVEINPKEYLAKLPNQD